MESNILTRTLVVSSLFILLCNISCSTGNEEHLKPGDRYIITKPLYLMAVFKEMQNKKLSPETASAYLHADRYYNKSWVAFQCEVPGGTVMTIIGSVSKPWYKLFYTPQYIVKLDPDLSQGLEIKISLDRGIGGKSEGLNREIFEKLPQP